MKKTLIIFGLMIVGLFCIPQSVKAQEVEGYWSWCYEKSSPNVLKKCFIPARNNVRREEYRNNEEVRYRDNDVVYRDRDDGYYRNTEYPRNSERSERDSRRDTVVDHNVRVGGSLRNPRAEYTLRVTTRTTTRITIRTP